MAFSRSLSETLLRLCDTDVELAKLGVGENANVRLLKVLGVGENADGRLLKLLAVVENGIVPLLRVLAVGERGRLDRIDDASRKREAIGRSSIDSEGVSWS